MALCPLVPPNPLEITTSYWDLLYKITENLSVCCALSARSLTYDERCQRVPRSSFENRNFILFVCLLESFELKSIVSFRNPTRYVKCSAVFLHDNHTVKGWWYHGSITSLKRRSVQLHVLSSGCGTWKKVDILMCGLRKWTMSIHMFRNEVYELFFAAWFSKTKLLTSEVFRLACTPTKTCHLLHVCFVEIQDVDGMCVVVCLC